MLFKFHFCTILSALNFRFKKIVQKEDIRCPQKSIHIRKKYGIHSHTPKSWSEHWNIFFELTKSTAFPTKWYCELIFFSDPWFEAASKDAAWKDFYIYMLKLAWAESNYWRDKCTFELIWERLAYDVLDRNIKPNLYVASIVKQLILTGLGLVPGLTVSDDADTSGPISIIQKIYLEDYRLKDYIPTVMQPHLFSLNDNYPTYYSLQYPNLLETVPLSRNLPSVLNAMPEIMTLMDAFSERVFKGCVDKNTPIDNFCKKAAFDCFHFIEEKRNNIHATAKLPLADNRLNQYPIKSKNKIFAESSQFLRGCVRICGPNLRPQRDI